MALPPPPPIQADRSTNGNGQPPPAPIKPAANASPTPGQSSQTQANPPPSDLYAQDRANFGTTPYEDIAPVEPVNLGDTEAFQDSIQKQRGTFLGYNELHNEVWQEPDKPDGTKGSRYILQQGEQPYSDTRYYENQGPRQFTFKEGAYMPEINKVVAEYNGRDPWTNEAFVGSNGPGKPLTDDDKVALAGKIEAWNKSNDIEPYQDKLDQQRETIEQYDQMRRDMGKLSDSDIGLWANILKKWNQATQGDFVKNGGAPEDMAKRAAVVDLTQRIQWLRARGMATLGAPAEQAPPSSAGVKAPPLAMLAKGATGMIGGAIAENIIEKGADAIGYLTSGGNLAGLRLGLPSETNDLKKSYFNDISTLASNRYRVTQNMRDNAKRYGQDLVADKIYRNTPATLSEPIPEGPPSAAKQQSGWYSRGYQKGGLVMPPPAPISKRQSLAQPVPSYASQAELNAAGHPAGTRFHWQPTNREYVTT